MLIKTRKIKVTLTPEQEKALIEIFGNAKEKRLKREKERANDPNPYRHKECYTGRGDVRAQNKRHHKKYYQYEKSWGGRYSNYECLLRIDPNLFQ